MVDSSGSVVIITMLVGMAARVVHQQVRGDIIACVELGLAVDVNWVEEKIQFVLVICKIERRKEVLWYLIIGY